MGKKLTIVIDADSKLAKREMASLEKSISRLEKAKAKISNPTRTKSKFNDTELRDYKRIAKQIDSARLANHKAQIRQAEITSRKEAKLAEEAARRITATKKAELANLNNVEKLKVRQSEISTRKQAKLVEEASRRITASKKAELTKFNNIEKSKLRQQEISARQRAKVEELNLRNVEKQRARDYREFVRQERLKTKAVRDGVKSRFNAQKIGGGLQQGGQGLQSAGIGLTTAVSAPLAAFATLGVKSALELDKARTKLIALEGTAEQADAKIRELNKLADSSVGVLRSSARETFAQLKGISDESNKALTIDDGTINKTITALGKLNAAFKIEDQAGFVQNLNQIFSQGFERSDIKEAIGKVPFFEQLLEQAFGTKDGDKLRKLKESGELTIDSFLSGISGSINNDQRIKSIGENASVKLAKNLEVASEAFAPLGNAILENVIPIIIQLTPYIESLGKQFASLSPYVQTVVVIFAGVIAVLGPVLAIIGTLVIAIAAIIPVLAPVISGITAFISLVGAAGLTATLSALLSVVGGALISAFTAAAPVILAIGAALAIVGVAIAGAVATAILLYEAYQNNFGGLKDFVDDIFNGISSAISSAMTAISAFVGSQLEQIQGFWRENGADITASAKSVYDFLASIVKIGLDAIRSFWEANGQYLIAIVTALWNNIKTVVSNGINVILNVIRLVSAVINQDWSAAWESLKQVILSASSIISSIMSNLVKVIVSAFLFVVNGLYEAGKAITIAVTKVALSIVDVFVSVLSLGFLKSDLAGAFGALVDPLEKAVGGLVPPVENAKNELGNINIFGGLSESVKQGAKQAIPLIKQSGKELKATLDELSKNANISPATRKALQKEVKDIGEKVSVEAKEASTKLKKSFGDLQKTLNTLLDNPQVSDALKGAIKKELTSIDNQIKNTAPLVKSSGILLGKSFGVGTTTAIANSKGQIHTAQKTAIKTNPSFAQAQGNQIGMAIVDGITQGIRSKASTAFNEAKNMISGVISIMRTVPIIKSPSRVTFKIGEFISEGLALGIESKIGRVKNSAKKVAKETLKALKEAAEKFRDLSGLGAKQVQQKLATEELNTLTSSLEEIIKLRGETGFDLDKALPSTKDGIKSELKYLQDFTKLGDEAVKKEQQLADDKAQKAKDYEGILKNIQGSADAGIINLKEEQQLLRLVSEVKKQIIIDEKNILRLRTEMSKDEYTKEQIDQAVKLQKIENERYLVQLRILEKRKQVKDAEDLGFDLQKQLNDLQSLNPELTVYEETLEKINSLYKDIPENQRKGILETAKKIDQIKELKEAYSDLKGEIRDLLGYIFDGDFKGLIKSFGDRIKDVFLDRISGFFASKLTGFNQKENVNKTAKPIVDKLDKTNKVLKQIRDNVGSANSPPSSISLDVGTLTNGLTSGPGSPVSIGHEDIHSNIGQHNVPNGVFDLDNLIGLGASVSNGKNDFFSQLKSLFSTGEGGLFAPVNGDGALGIAGGISSIGSLLGGLIGGRAGGLIGSTASGIGTGASIGSMIAPGIGTILGSIIGGAVGFFSSIFGNPKQKRDRKEKMPQLEQGFAEAIKQLKEIASDKNAILNDPFGTLKQAESIRDEVQSGFGIKFESKKYRRISQQKISAKTAEANLIVDEIASFSERAKAANETDKRLVAQFAGGVYMDTAFKNQYLGYKRRNGILPGAYSNGDVLPSLLAGQEMVLNPNQQINVIKNAGGVDVFRGANIPGYAEGKAPRVKPIARPQVSSTSVGSNQPINVNIYTSNKGMVESDIEVVVDGRLDAPEVKTKIYENNEKQKVLNRD